MSDPSMGIEVVRATEETLDRWDTYLERSPHPSPFHRRAFLEAVESHGTGRFHPLVGFKGEEPIGLLPLFESAVGPFTMVHSPPPGFQIGFLGPLLLNSDQMKQRRQEQTNERFVDSYLEWIDREIDPDFVYFRCSPEYDDIRPFLWNHPDYTVEPEYTYVVDLTRGADELLRSFNKQARQNIRYAQEADCEVRPTNDRSEVERVISHYLERHPRDDSAAAFDTAFAMDIYDALDSNIVSCHVCYVDGEYAGGSFDLVGGDTIYGWVGGAASDVDVPVNDLLYWHEITNGIENGFERIDFLGAMKPSLCEFKSKFNPTLRPKFTVRRSTSQMELASGVYDRLPRRLKPLVS